MDKYRVLQKPNAELAGAEFREWQSIAQNHGIHLKSNTWKMNMKKWQRI